MKGSETKERLLQIGLDEMSVHGLAGVTLGQLATKSGLSKSGLFAHFRSKEQLQIALLDEVTQAADRVIVVPAMQAAEGLPRLIAITNNWLGWSRRAGLNGGCPVAAALFELDDIESEVRLHAAKLEQHWRAQLRDLVMEAKFLLHLSDDTDVEQFVWELCGIYLSHHVSSRFLRDPEADARAKKAFDALIGRHRPSAVPARSAAQA
jgi:AcrR family transcriptional regulator